MTYPLDTATQVERVGDNTFRNDGGGEYWNMRSGFGGWALALAHTTVCEAMPQSAMLASINANFMKPLPDAGILIDVSVLHEARRTNFMRTEFRKESDELQSPLFTADLVYSDPRKPSLDYTAPFPDVKPPEASDVIPSSPGPKWLSRYEQRVGLGKPFSAQEHPHSAVWVRETSDRPWDAKALIALSDTPMPRTFFLDPMPRFSGTVSYSLHVFCTAEDLAQLGSDYLLVEASADRMVNGRFSQTTKIWSADRQLLATSYQLAFF